MELDEGGLLVRDTLPGHPTRLLCSWMALGNFQLNEVEVPELPW